VPGPDRPGDPLAFGVPAADAPGMTEVVLAMARACGNALPQTMGNAGRALAPVTRRRFLSGDLFGRHIVVLAGFGGNGGTVGAVGRLAGGGFAGRRACGSTHDPLGVGIRPPKPGQPRRPTWPRTG